MKVTALILLASSAWAGSADLFEAARNNDVARTKQLISDGTDVNKLDSKGYTPLILAAYNGSADVVKVLIENKADVHAHAGMGGALIAASFKGFQDIVAALIAAGARVNDTNQAGGTALMFASMSAKKDVVLLLIKHGADISARDRRGLDAATLAEQQGSTELAEFLRKAAKSK